MCLLGYLKLCEWLLLRQCCSRQSSSIADTNVKVVSRASAFQKSAFHSTGVGGMQATASRAEGWCSQAETGETAGG